MNDSIYLFSAPIRAGKTTALRHWAEERQDVGGFLTPDASGGRRLFALQARRWFPFELTAGSTEPAVEVGKFRFAAASFVLARRLMQADAAAGCAWTVVDEVGKLELLGEGFEPALGTLVKGFQAGRYAGRLLLVVRQSLLAEVQTRYHLEQAPVLRLGEPLP